jgi:hypothetical protein
LPPFLPFLPDACFAFLPSACFAFLLPAAAIPSAAGPEAAARPGAAAGLGAAVDSSAARLGAAARNGSLFHLASALPRDTPEETVGPISCTNTMFYDCLIFTMYYVL